MLRGEATPNDRLIAKTVGQRAALWSDLRAYLRRHYDHEPELSFDGPKHGWAIRYRRSGRTLVTLYPEHDSFTVLIVLGKDETAKAEQQVDRLGMKARTLLAEAPRRKDGCWLWIRPTSQPDLEGIKAVLAVKRRPKDAKR
jgi:hypothetical protein